MMVGMRRFLAMLVLLAGGLSGLAGPACPLVVSGGQGSAASELEGNGSGHAHSHHDRAPAPRDDVGDPAGRHGPAQGDECRGAMQCGAAVIVASLCTATEQVWATNAVEAASPEDPFTTTSPGQDPPPPRLPV